MSLRGVGKALYRTPHQLFGQKTQEDVIFKQWGHDIKTALAGLEYLKSENLKWKKFWISFITNFVQVINIFRDLHCELIDTKMNKDQNEGKSVDRNEEFTSVTIHEIEQATKLARIILDKITQLTDDSFSKKCDEMIENLKGVEKLITKRDHKKIDYDIQTKHVESILKGSLTSDKDRTKLESDQKKLTENEIIYRDFNDKIKLIIPEILSNLSEFLNKLTYKFYYSNYDILDFIQRNIAKFNRIHGIASDESILTYEQIISDFYGLYSNAQEKLESLTLLKDFRSLRNKNLGEKTAQQVNNAAGTVVDSTVNFTSTIYTKASKPNQKLSLSLTSVKIENPVRPYDKHGMFTTALDPIEFMSNMSLANDLSGVNNNISQDSPISNFRPDVPHTDQSEKSTVDTDWMKPLKNSTLNRPNTSTTEGMISDKITLDSSIDTKFPNESSEDKSTAHSQAASLSLSSKTETYKYLNVTMDSITQKLCLLMTTPEIKNAPVTVLQKNFGISDYKSREFCVARSSITANAFAAYANI